MSDYIRKINSIYKVTVSSHLRRRMINAWGQPTSCMICGTNTGIGWVMSARVDTGVGHEEALYWLCLHHVNPYMFTSMINDMEEPLFLTLVKELCSGYEHPNLDQMFASIKQATHSAFLKRTPNGVVVAEARWAHHKLLELEEIYIVSCMAHQYKSKVHLYELIPYQYSFDRLNFDYTEFDSKS